MWKWQNIKTGRRFSKINVYSSIFEKEVTRGNLGLFDLAVGKQKINKYQNASPHGILVFVKRKESKRKKYDMMVKLQEHMNGICHWGLKQDQQQLGGGALSISSSVRNMYTLVHICGPVVCCGSYSIMHFSPNGSHCSVHIIKAVTQVQFRVQALCCISFPICLTVLKEGKTCLFFQFNFILYLLLVSSLSLFSCDISCLHTQRIAHTVCKCHVQIHINVCLHCLTHLMDPSA